MIEVSSMIRKRKLQWFGHVMSCVEEKMLNAGGGFEKMGVTEEDCVVGDIREKGMCEDDVLDLE